MIIIITRVYGVETSVTLLDTPGVESGQTTLHCPLSRLMVNTLNESLHWVLLKTQVEREARDLIDALGATLVSYENVPSWAHDEEPANDNEPLQLELPLVGGE